MKNPAHLYEVSFFSALWMVFPESWKRRAADFYAHHCRSQTEVVSQKIGAIGSDLTSGEQRVKMISDDPFLFSNPGVVKTQCVMPIFRHHLSNCLNSD